MARAYRSHGHRLVPFSTIRRRMDAADARFAAAARREASKRALGLGTEYFPFASVEIVRAASPDADELEAWDHWRAAQLEPVAEDDVLTSELEGTRCTMQSCGLCGRCC